MKFRSMRFKNFLSFGDDEQTIHFIANDVVLILGNNYQTGGSNGAGKSVILNAITWAIYGRTTKLLAADEVVNNITDRDAVVSLEFTIGNQYILITRSRKLDGKKNKHKLELTVDGVNKTLANMADTQILIDNLIKINFRSFISSIMFSQDRVFNFSEATQVKRKEIIENVLQVDNLSIYEKLIKNEIADYKARYDQQYYSSQAKKDLAKSLLVNIQDYLGSCKLKSKTLANKIKELNAKLAQLQKIDVGSEKEKYKENERIEKQITAISAQLDTWHVKSTTTKKDIAKLAKEKKLAEENFNNAAKDFNKVKKEIDSAEQNKEICPVCENQIRPDRFEKYINDKKCEYDRHKKDRVKYELALNKLGSTATKAIEKDTQLDNTINKLNNDLGKQKTKVKHTLVTLKELEHIVEQQNDLISQASTLGEQKKHIMDLKYIENIKTQIKDAKKTVKEILADLERIQDDIDHYNFWAVAFSKGENTIRSFLVNKIIDFINSRINHYLGMFFTEEVDFVLDREMDHTIRKNRKDISLAQLSGGESQRLNLAIAFSLFDLVKVNLGNDINIIWLDEVLDRNLDENGITALLKIIEDLKEKGNGVYVISHKDTFKSYFDNTIVVYKTEEGISKILAA